MHRHTLNAIGNGKHFTNETAPEPCCSDYIVNLRERVPDFHHNRKQSNTGRGQFRSDKHERLKAKKNVAPEPPKYASFVSSFVDLLCALCPQTQQLLLHSVVPCLE